MDSSYLLYAAKQAGADVRPYFAKTQFQPEFELENAKRLAELVDIELTILPYDVLPAAGFNPPDRCYYCKTALFGALVAQAKADGYVTTLWGRRRYLPELKSKNFNMRSFGERVALNTPIQGTAADIIKAAMVHVEDRLQREGRKARLLLQVHDELIIECPPEEVEPVKALLVEEMEHAFPLSVKLVADVSEGENWYDAKK